VEPVNYENSFVKMGKTGKRFLTAESAEGAKLQRVFSLRKDFSLPRTPRSQR